MRLSKSVPKHETAGLRIHMQSHCSLFSLQEMIRSPAELFYEKLTGVACLFKPADMSLPNFIAIIQQRLASGTSSNHGLRRWSMVSPSLQSSAESITDASRRNRTRSADRERNGRLIGGSIRYGTRLNEISMLTEIVNSFLLF